ncbi:hypothetical protein MUDAN_MDHGFNIF_01145 [Lactiplantibacillus mudanjiangensis]|uniref:Uncharacterized protein n=1 Tax=Lactiplantibacillus mudanjiangensis TaxID=1296538 RepID=A0A660EAQ0_9LACO|nr:hypothetical protein MUDAN_IGPPGNFN_01768 [Lactiplantibacillus mudanjiangensis]VDG29585.1 hypothetical protein MUDAN_MDHGFNIF_01145 [Lactiplantibacillus mudanjiangensis]
MMIVNMMKPYRYKNESDYRCRVIAFYVYFKIAFSQ